MSAVEEAFAALPRAIRDDADGAVTFATSVLPGHPRCRAARDALGRPALLVAGCSSLVTETPTELRNFAFLPAADCVLEDGTRSVFTILRCKSEDPKLQDW